MDRRGIRNNIGVRHADIVLVSMPFGPLLEPSLGLSLLKATLAPGGFEARILYLTLQFAKAIGTGLYSAIAGGAPHSTTLVGEWIFEGDLNNIDPAGTEEYIDVVLKGALEHYSHTVTGRQPVTDDFVAAVLRARALVPSFLEAATQQVLEVGAPIVGFTSVFQQQIASLALAQRLKAKAPELTVVFGGANCEGEMGTEVLRQFPFVDAVVSGEGEEVIIPMVDAMLSGTRSLDLPGVYTRNQVVANEEQSLKMPNFPNAPGIRSLNSLPCPSFDDFFDQMSAADLHSLPESRLLFESARGCWWGAKHHCTFCGLNGATMDFRSKTADRVLAELSRLQEKYPGRAISFVDNILDMSYFKDLLPAIIDSAVDLDLFFEVKANLRRDQVSLLKRAGITQIQPGIESLSTAVLSQMRKGVTALQNIQLLKWCKEFGVEPHWNLLWGFPGEDPEEYRQMVELIPLIYHLPPPTGGALIRLDRFSPNFTNADDFGFDNVRPCAAYSYLYPAVSDDGLARLAYFFSFTYKRPQDLLAYVGPVAAKIASWQDAYERSDLFCIDKGDRLLVWDFRPGAKDALVILDGIHRAVLLACEVARSAEKIAAVIACEFGTDDSEHVKKVLEYLKQCGFVISEGDRWLGLVIPLGEYSPGPAAVEQFLKTIKALGRTQGSVTILSRETVERIGRP